jgi:hypothetical protein
VEFKGPGGIHGGGFGMHGGRGKFACNLFAMYSFIPFKYIREIIDIFVDLHA